MDNLTHALLGAAVVRVGKVLPEHTRGIRLAVLISSQAPDLDLLPGLLHPQAQLELHRGYSHSLLGSAVIAGLVALLVGIFDPRVPRRKTLLWALIAVGVHQIFDALTTYGTLLLYPISPNPVALDVLFGVDIFILCTLGLGFLLSRSRPQALVAALGIVIFYLGAKYGLQRDLSARVAGNFPAANFSVVPGANPFGPWIIVLDEQGIYRVGRISPYAKGLGQLTAVHKNLDNPMVKKIAAHPVIESYLKIARHPHATIVRSGPGWKIKFSDLRLYPYEKFNAIVYLNEEMKVESIIVGPKN